MYIIFKNMKQYNQTSLKSRQGGSSAQTSSAASGQHHNYVPSSSSHINKSGGKVVTLNKKVAGEGVQNISQNNTPKGNKKASIIVSSQHTHQNQYTMQVQQQKMMMQQSVAAQAYKESQNMLFDNRKRSAEINSFQQIQSKSTKVSPQRVASKMSQHTSGSQGPNPLQAKLNQGFEGIKQNQMNSMDIHSAAREQHAQPNLSSSHMNTYQYFNFEMDGISPVLVSQTTGVSKAKKDLMGSRGSMPGVILPANNLLSGVPMPVGGGGTLGSHPHQTSDEITMDSSMHQSFINLIYPSKSKKLMTNELSGSVVVQQSKENLSTASIPQQTNSSAGGTSSHHQKSKSLYVGGSISNPSGSNSHIVQNFVKPVAHQLAPKGAGPGSVQKMNQSQYKKQSNIFTYSQRFKELLSETIAEDKVLQQSQHQQAVSSHHSPMGVQQQQHFINPPQSHIMVNFNDILIQQQRSGGSQAQSAHQKGTFDNKQIVSQTQQQQTHGSYITINDNTNQAATPTPQLLQSGANRTIDYVQGNPYVLKQQTLHNTPNSSQPGVTTKGIVVSQKSKVIAEPPPSKNMAAAQHSLHQRKPSHPVTNNYMLELLQGPPNIVQQQQQVQQTQYQQNAIQTQNQLAQYQMMQPVREKKQHQPTQSKQKQVSSNPTSANHHQRSISDYLIQQQHQAQMNRYLNPPVQEENIATDHTMGRGYGQDIQLESFENLENTIVQHSGQVNIDNPSHRVTQSQPGGTLLNNFMQQAFSQMLYEGGISTGQPLSHREVATKQAYIVLNPQSTGGLLQDSGKTSAMTSSQPQLMTSSQGGTYQYRKMSLQQQHALQQKKSPQKQKMIEPQQMLQAKRKLSPTNQAVSQNNNYIQGGIVSQQSAPKTIPISKTASNNVTPPQIQQQSGHPLKATRTQIPSPTNQTALKKQVLPSSSASAIPQQQQNAYPQAVYHHTRSNSDLMKQQIMAAQAAALKKPQTSSGSQRPNPAINTHQVVTNIGAPPGGYHHQKAKSELTTPRQMAQNKQTGQKKQNAATTPANVSIDLVKNQQNTQKPMSKNGSSSALGNKYSQDATPRTVAQATISPPKKQTAMPQAKRYSMQNSPRAQQNNGQHKYNLSQQYQMFQQVLAKQQKQTSQFTNKIESVSPQNVIHSFIQGTQIQPRASLISNQGVAPTKSGQGVATTPAEDEQAIALAHPGYHKRGVSETEYLLNQIRNNINTLKAYQPYGEVADIQKGSQVIERQDSAQDAIIKKDPIHKKVFRENNLKLTSEPSIENVHAPLPTDPNMSPYSKDLQKLQKLIRFNFRKFNEAPATTSEFYRIGRVLGRGAFGKVNLAAHKISEQLVAIKSINKDVLRSSKTNQANAAIQHEGEHPEKKKVMQEFAILKQSNHQSVVRLYDTFETTKHICFVMELCAGGDLLTYVRKRRKLTEDVAKYFFKQLIEGLAYLHHSKLIVHRDIKLDNILLDANGRIKIADFGVSRQLNNENDRMTEQCGTPAYIAPEILKDKGYEGFKVDVWSAGVCLYAMLIGTVPFKASTMQELHNMIINGKYDINNPNANQQNKDGSATTQPQQPPVKLSEHATNLIHSLLQVDPRKRLSAVEVLSHPWLKDAKDEMDVFTQKEKDVIHKEYLAKNIDKTFQQLSSKPVPDFNGTGQLQLLPQDTEVIFTEHNLDTKTNMGSFLKNASTKSIILAPFNSTVSEIQLFDEEGKEKPYQWPDEVRRLIVPKRVLKFAPKVKDLDRQYEHNNNADLDNGVYNNIDDPANNRDEEDEEDSLKGSFKDTELSSDDEHAEEEATQRRQRQKEKEESELIEFEKQIKMKYVRYQEPVEVIDRELVSKISIEGGVYPKEYLMRALQSKEMNYATANYHLLLKKQQFLAKQQLQIIKQQ